MVATIDDLLAGSVRAASEPTNERLKNLLDISRILETYPHLRSAVPPAILAQLIA